MVSKSYHLQYHFSIPNHLHLASFHGQNTLKKISLEEMLIEQIIAFEMRGLGLPGSG